MLTQVKRITALTGLLLILTPTAQAQGWQLVDESELWLAGTSSVNSFECQATSMAFDYDVAYDIEGSGFSLPGMALVVSVRDLDCDNRRMNRDMRGTMRAKEHPHIRLEVHRIDLVPESADARVAAGADAGVDAGVDAEQTASPEMEVHGTMTLAGVSQTIAIRVRGWLDETLRLHGTGTLDVKMTDFGMEPPTALFGLIKAHDDIRIRFYLVAKSSGEFGQALAPRP